MILFSGKGAEHKGSFPFICKISYGCITENSVIIRLDDYCIGKGEDMGEGFIAGKRKDEWLREYPLLEDISERKEVLWVNPGYTGVIDKDDIQIDEAEQRLQRFAPYIGRVFPETAKSGGLIESPLAEAPAMQRRLEEQYGITIPHQLLVKYDSHLPISGSVKARGGIYEVLAYAERLAIEHGLLSVNDDYTILDSEQYRRFFSKFSVAVGSTGNLGLSIGVIAAAIGFRVTVHMSAEAKQWKKDLLRKKGAIVVEYNDDYSLAVAEGRKQAAETPGCHFIDDENSVDLFTGYATAGSRIASGPARTLKKRKKRWATWPRAKKT